MKNNKTISIIGAIALIVQSIAVFFGCLSCKKATTEKSGKPNAFLIILSVIGSIFGAFILYKEAIAPVISKYIDDMTEIDDIEDDDTLSFDDFWSKEEAEEN